MPKHARNAPERPQNLTAGRPQGPQTQSCVTIEAPVAQITSAPRRPLGRAASRLSQAGSSALQEAAFVSYGGGWLGWGPRARRSRHPQEDGSSSSSRSALFVEPLPGSRPPPQPSSPSFTLSPLYGRSARASGAAGRNDSQTGPAPPAPSSNNELEPKPHPHRRPRTSSSHATDEEAPRRAPGRHERPTTKPLTERLDDTSDR